MLVAEPAVAIDPANPPAIQPINAAVELTSGKTVTGPMALLNTDSIELQDQRPINLDEVASIVFPDIERRDSTETSVALINDSLIAANNVTFDGKTVLIDLRRQPDFEASADQVVAIRFRSQTVATDKAWLGLVSQDSAADRMVIRREGERLDSIEGVIESIQNDMVKFTIDDNAVEAPISKLEGVIFHGGGKAADSQDPQSQAIGLDDAYGGRWRAGGITFNGTEFELTAGSLRHRIPGDQVRSIRFGGSRLALAKAERASSKWNAPFGTQLPTAATDAFFLSAVSEAGDLELPAGTQIVFRVPDGMSRLAGSVGRPPKILFGGRVGVVIRDGDRILWQSTLEGAERQGFDFEIAGGRRMAIEVTDGNDGNLGDVIRFTSARFVR